MSTAPGVGRITPSRHPYPSANRLVAWPLSGDLLATAYVALIAGAAVLTGAPYLMFPELGALSNDTLTRPRAVWASAPVLLVVTPVLTALIGTIVTRSLPYGYLSVMMTVASSAAVILLLDSPIAPAVSAGLLPVVLGMKSWAYAPGILASTTLLALLSSFWRKVAPRWPDRTVPADYSVIPSPAARYWLPALLALVAVGVFCVELSGMRFILFPPLVTIGFEMFGHPARCPWARRPALMPIECFLTAAGGLFFYKIFGVSALSASCSMIWGILVLRALDLYVPPALAVALLPLVMDKPTIVYPLSVAAGTFLLTGWYLLFRLVLVPGLEPAARPQALGG
jgi:hypothetical protein